MKVLINPTIIINEPIERKCWGYTIELDKKNHHQFRIKATGANNKPRGIAGWVKKDGQFIIQPKFKDAFLPFLNKEIRKKTAVMLDLVYGRKRELEFICNKDGLIIFQRHIELTKPKNMKLKKQNGAIIF